MTPEEQKANTLNQIIDGFISDIKSVGVGSVIVSIAFDDEQGTGEGRIFVEGPTPIIASMVEKLAASLSPDVFIQLLAVLAYSPVYAKHRHEEEAPLEPKKVN